MAHPELREARERLERVADSIGVRLRVHHPWRIDHIRFIDSTKCADRFSKIARQCHIAGRVLRCHVFHQTVDLGQKLRLDLARELLHGPQLLLQCFIRDSVHVARAKHHQGLAVPRLVGCDAVEALITFFFRLQIPLELGQLLGPHAWPRSSRQGGNQFRNLVVLSPLLILLDLLQRRNVRHQRLDKLFGDIHILRPLIASNRELRISLGEDLGHCLLHLGELLLHGR
mmetsp:Transcript_152145/g.486149  ORF Transcript_152145/g.486149 Transcript_152145/m.486149 type:complete len:228 (-) Transcript_152145:1459-2142(-)